MVNNDIPALWANALRSVTQKYLDLLRAERGYRPEFCHWLHEKRLIGVLDGSWAFPNSDRHDQIVSIHYRAGNTNWRYHPPGQKTYPLVIRGSGPISSCHDFESQWDAFAIMDRLELYERSDFMAIITRGATNGALVGNAELPKDVEVFIWAQEDGELEEHKNKAPEDRPSERWIKAVKESHNGACRPLLLRPPVARWHEQALRIAIVLHAGLHGARASSESLIVDTTAKAIEISRWFGYEQLRLLSGARRAALQMQADNLRDLLLAKYPDGVSLRNLEMRHNREASLVRRIVAEFPTTFCIEEHRNPAGGRPSPQLYLASPTR
jgi:hypothetical protein